MDISAVYLALPILIVTAVGIVVCLLRPSPTVASITAATGVLCLLISSPLEGGTLFELTPGNGFTQSDLIGLIAIAVGSVTVVRSTTVSRRWIVPGCVVALVLGIVIAKLINPSPGLTTGPKPASPATAHQAKPLGITAANDVANLSSDELDRELAAIADTGAKWVRITFNWAMLEQSPGKFSWSDQDRVVKSARAHNLRILGLLAGPAPTWTVDPTTKGSALGFVPQDPETLGAFAKAAAKRYGSAIKTWEIWNEPNNPTYFAPRPDAARYAAMLKAAYQAIHSVIDKAVVLSGGLAPSSSGLIVAPVTYLLLLTGYGGADFLDGLAVHPYTYPFSIDNDPQEPWRQMQLLHNVLNAKPGNKKIWITEFGAPTGKSSISLSEDGQAKMLADAVAKVRSLPYVAMLIIYTAVDAVDDPKSPAGNFGVYRHDFSPKPAVEAIKNAQ